LSTRPQIKPFQVVVNGDMSANITSTPTIISNLSRLSYGISWSGTSPVGTLSVQASNDYALNPDGRTAANAGTWNTLTFMSGGSAVQSIAVSGNTGNGFIDIGPCGAYALRLVYTKTSGTGTLQATVVGKVS
jgi:hypothetical protein